MLTYKIGETKGAEVQSDILYSLLSTGFGICRTFLFITGTYDQSQNEQNYN
jgi:hypothetical protein